MAPTTVEDDFKLLYVYVKLTTSKPRMADVGMHMGLKPNAAAWRFNSLMKRLEKQFGLAEDLETSEVSSTPDKVNKGKKRGQEEAQGGADRVESHSKKSKTNAEAEKSKKVSANDKIKKEEDGAEVDEKDRA